MNDSVHQLGAAFAGLVLLCFIALEGKTVGQSLGWIDVSEDPVLVFTIPQDGNLARVRTAIHDERVLWEGDAGFALVGGRIYVKSPEQAGDLIKIGGWVDRPIKIVGLGMHTEESAGNDSPVVALNREERMVQLRKLVNKPSLTRGEQIFVLQAMNDGLEI